MIKRFTDPLPESIYLESSVICNVILTSGRFHKESADLMNRIRDEGVSCAISSLSLDEIWYMLIKNLVEEDRDEFLIKAYKKDPKSILIARDHVEKVTFDLLAINLEFLSIDLEIMLNAKDYLWQCSLLPRDAIHLAAALRYGIKAIATTDPDFANASELVGIYTCNPEILGVENETEG